MPARMSVATLDAPEFINITSINPKISKCEIKVLYVGANRNMSYISKEVALEMAQTLPGTPIVGHFIENKNDFGDHGQQVIIDDEGIKFNTLTTPYGFVAPDAKVWFQKFNETDEFGNVEVREYLMTEGYLWTEQFKECKRVIEEGNPQSMELDEDSLKGYWSTDYNKGVEFFIINDAIFSKLCILGEDVEPCFEGANITAPNISTQFSANKDFHKTLYSMMQELNEILKGGQKMLGDTAVVSENVEVDTKFEKTQDNVVEEVVAENDNNVEDISENNTDSLETPEAESTVEFSAQTETPKDSEESAVVAEEPTAVVVEEPAATTEEATVDFAKTECKPEEDDDKEDDTSDMDDMDDDKKKTQAAKCGDKDEKKKYSLLEEEYNTLKAQYADLESKYNELLSFKAEVESKEKDKLIDSFSMLTDEEKKDIIANKSNYSLDEIESKLSVMFTRKQMLAQSVEETKVVETPVIYSTHEDLSNIPDWVKAVREAEKTL